MNVPLSMIGMSVNQNIRFLTVSYVIKTKQEKRLTFQQSRLFIFFFNGYFSEPSVIDSKYIKMTELQDFY